MTNADVVRIEEYNKPAITGVIKDDKGRIDITFIRPIDDVLSLWQSMVMARELELKKLEIFRTSKVKINAILLIRAINEEVHCS